MAVLHERSGSEPHERAALLKLQKVLPTDWHLTTELRLGRASIDSLLATPYGIFVLELKECRGTVIPHSEKNWEGAGLPQYMRDPAYAGNPFIQAERNAKILANNLHRKKIDEYVDWVVVVSGTPKLRLDDAEIHDFDSVRISEVADVYRVIVAIHAASPARHRALLSHEQITSALEATLAPRRKTAQRSPRRSPAYVRVSSASGFDHVYYETVRLGSEQIRGTGSRDLRSIFRGGGLKLSFLESAIEVRALSEKIVLNANDRTVRADEALLLNPGQHEVTIGGFPLMITVGNLTGDGQ